MFPVGAARLLIVDDDAELLAAYTLFFCKYGFDIRTALNGADAKPQRSLRLSKSHTQASAARREIVIRNLINVGTIPYMLLARLACQSCYHETPQQ